MAKSNELNLTNLNPFPHTDTFWRLSSRRLLKTFGKKRNCSWWAISPLATMFSTQFSNQTFINEHLSCIFPIFFERRLLYNWCIWERNNIWSFCLILFTPHEITPPIWKHFSNHILWKICQLYEPDLLIQLMKMLC